jgi:hypothetical protein
MANGGWRVSGGVGNSAFAIRHSPFAIRHRAEDAFARIDQLEKIDGLCL